MRVLELAKVAAAAEALRVKRFTRRQAFRLGYLVGAVVFALAALAMLHSLAVVLLSLAMPVWLAILIVLVIDLAVGGVLFLLGWNSVPDRVEREAAAVRRQSLDAARDAATSLATVGEVAGLAIGMAGRRKAKTGRLGRAWMIADLASRFVRR